MLLLLLLFIIYVISPNLWKYIPSIPYYKMLFKILPHCLNPSQSQTWHELHHFLPHCAHSIMHSYASKHSEHRLFEMLLYNSSVYLNTYNIIGIQNWSNKCLVIWLLSWWVSVDISTLQKISNWMSTQKIDVNGQKVS